MANSRKTTPKSGTLTQFPTPETDIAVADPPESEIETPFDGPEPTLPPASPAPMPKRPATEPTFFQKVAAVPAADWGTRVYLYLYVIEPVCNLKQSGGKSYLMRYEEPIVSEHPIMLEHGSGKYRFILAKNKYTLPKAEGDKAGNEIGMLDFEIFNPQYPPKIPREAWANDSKNRRWESLLPKPIPSPAPGAANGLSEFVEVLRATNDMRREVREEVQASTPTPAPVAAPASTAPAAADPFDTVAKIMGMRSNDPMITLLLSRMEAQDKAMEQARQREYDLQKELRQSQTVQQTAAAPKTLLEQLKELGELKTLAGTLFGAATEGAPVRPGKFGWLDFAREVIPTIVESPILNSLASRIAAGPATLPQFNPAAPVNGTGPANTDDPLRFVQAVITPAMLEYFRTGNDGATFAAWVDDGYPGRVAQLQSFGEQRIFALYRTAPAEVTSIIFAHGEPAFAKFIHEFCEWRPEPDEDEHTGSAAATNPANVIIDLDADDENGKGGDNS